MDRMNKILKDFQLKAKQLWNENPVLCIFLGIASANAGAKLINANSNRKNVKTWDREVKRREQNDRTKK